MQREYSGQLKPYLDVQLQWAFATSLAELADQTFHAVASRIETLAKEDRVAIALMNKARLSFDAVGVLCERLMVGDARILIRAITEAIVNAAYIAEMGAEAADDYVDSTFFWRWKEYTDLIALNPGFGGFIPEDEVTELKARHDAVKGRFEGFRKGDWCRDSLFKRATVLDSRTELGDGFRIIVSLLWRQPSSYVHGTGSSVGAHRGMTNPLALTQQTPEEAARTLYMSNILMFVLLAILDGYLENGNALAASRDELWQQFEERTA